MAKQLTLSHENLPGMLASIAKVLSNEKVNILSCLTMTSGTTGTTHLVVDNVDKAKKSAGCRGTAVDWFRITSPVCKAGFTKNTSLPTRRNYYYSPATQDITNNEVTWQSS